MSASQVRTAVVSSPFHPRNRRHILLAALVAVFGVSAIYLGIGSPFASAAPQSVPPSSATAPSIQDSQQWHTADADADVGPGQCEPCVVGSP